MASKKLFHVFIDQIKPLKIYNFNVNNYLKGEIFVFYNRSSQSQAPW